MDDIDRAQERAETFLEDCLRTARGIPVSTGTLSEFCEDCGEEILAARRAAVPDCTRCADCQQEHERGR